MECVKQFLLKAIKSDRQHYEAVAALSRLTVRGDLDHGGLEYVEALAKLVAEYESHAAARVRRADDPIGLLKFLMAESGMSVTKLSSLLGSQGVASEVLSGKWELSKAHIRSLARHFHVDPGLLL